VSIGMLIGVAVSLAIALVFQDIDSALLILTLASVLIIAVILLRPSRPQGSRNPFSAIEEDDETSGPQSALT